jgi:hypothetical protein
MARSKSVKLVAGWVGGSKSGFIIAYSNQKAYLRPVLKIAICQLVEQPLSVMKDSGSNLGMDICNLIDC